MNVNEIKQARKELEFSILEQVRGFEAATGMTVESIAVKHASHYKARERETVEIEVGVQL